MNMYLFEVFQRHKNIFLCKNLSGKIFCLFFGSGKKSNEKLFCSGKHFPAKKYFPGPGKLQKVTYLF